LSFPSHRTTRILIVHAVWIGACIAPGRGFAESGRVAAERAPVPEPLLTETVTDIDGADRGEYELELNGSELRSIRGGAYVLQSSVEAEWLATRHLGIRVEPTFTRSLEAPGSGSSQRFGAAGALSWKVLQDIERDAYAQVELAGRAPRDVTLLTDPGESSLPFTLDLRGAVRSGRWTLRGSFGAAAGGTSAHAPFRGSFAVLTGFTSTERYGFWGVEADVDGTRQNPTVLALNLMPHLGPIGLPVRFGIAIPWVVGVNGDRPSTGVFFRILIESAREYRYGETGE
jgi:hypothetical protein